MENEEKKSIYEELADLMGKVEVAMQMSRHKQEYISALEESLYEEMRPMAIEEKKEGLEKVKNDKAEFDEMTKNALVNAKKQVLQLREESEEKYNNKLVETVNRNQQIKAKLASMRKRNLPEEKLMWAEASAQKASEKVNESMKNFQDKHLEFRGKLDAYEQTIRNFATELGFENEIEDVKIDDDMAIKNDKQIFGKGYEEFLTEQKANEQEVEQTTQQSAQQETQQPANPEPAKQPTAQQKVEPQPTAEPKVVPQQTAPQPAESQQLESEIPGFDEFQRMQDNGAELIDLFTRDGSKGESNTNTEMSVNQNSEEPARVEEKSKPVQQGAQQQTQLKRQENKKIKIVFDAKKQLYTMRIAKDEHSFYYGVDEVKEISLAQINNSEEFIKFEKALSEQYKNPEDPEWDDSRYGLVDPYVAFLIKTSGLENSGRILNNYVESIMDENPKEDETLTLQYHMDGIYGRKYSSELSNAIMARANEHARFKWADVYKNRFTKFMEEHEGLRKVWEAVTKIGANQQLALPGTNDSSISKGTTQEHRRSSGRQNRDRGIIRAITNVFSKSKSSHNKVKKYGDDESEPANSEVSTNSWKADLDARDSVDTAAALKKGRPTTIKNPDGTVEHAWSLSTDEAEDLEQDEDEIDFV